MSYCSHSALSTLSLSQLECVHSYANTQIDFGNSIGATRDESVFTDLNSCSESKKKKKTVFSWYRLPTVSLARASIEICWPCFTYFMGLLFLFLFFFCVVFHFPFSVFCLLALCVFCIFCAYFSSALFRHPTLLITPEADALEHPPQRWFRPLCVVETLAKAKVWDAAAAALVVAAVARSSYTL